MIVKIKKLRDDAAKPEIGSKFSAGYDLRACLDYEILSISPHQTVKVSTGLAMEIPIGYFGAIFARSGVATKKGMRPANCVGVIDADYRGEIIVAIHNDTDFNQVIENGERIAQIVILPCNSVDFKVVDELSSTDRGDGGFGSSGEKEVKKKKPRDSDMRYSVAYGEW